MPNSFGTSDTEKANAKPFRGEAEYVDPELAFDCDSDCDCDLDTDTDTDTDVDTDTDTDTDTDSDPEDRENTPA